MQDADEHYFNVRRLHDRTIECVRKRTTLHIHSYDVQTKQKAFNNLEAMKAKHHMKDATNITLPS